MDRLKDGTKVHHTIEDYAGVLCGITRIKNLFENNDDDWEYRVDTGENRIKIASPQNIIVASNAAKYEEVVARGKPTRMINNRTSAITDFGRIFQYESFGEIHDILKSTYPKHLIIIQKGYMREVQKEDAFYLSDRYGWEVGERQKGVPMTGFPENATSVWEDLKINCVPYLIVSQLPTQGHTRIERYVSEIHSFDDT